MSGGMSFCLFRHQFVHLYFHMSVSKFVHLSLCLSICHHIHTYLRVLVSSNTHSAGYLGLPCGCSNIVGRRLGFSDIPN